jgi:alkylation response protein AidB-like acyl-CoA dehydrogenase
MEMGYNLAFLQLILLATIAGVGRAALRDTVKFVQGRTRTFGVMGQTSPRNEPLVQRVVGRISSISFAADSIVNNLAQILEEAHQTHQAGHATQATFVDTQIRAYQAQQMVIDLILQETSQLFEVGGASATSTDLGLDRHWRNARTAASHNPAIYRERVVGDFLLNGTIPESNWGKPIKAKTARSEEKPFEETPQEEQPNEPLATVGECSNRR